jgi:hypothetical protein
MIKRRQEMAHHLASYANLKPFVTSLVDSDSESDYDPDEDEGDAEDEAEITEDAGGNGAEKPTMIPESTPEEAAAAAPEVTVPPEQAASVSGTDVEKTTAAAVTENPATA